jgi:hypothetical protein
LRRANWLKNAKTYEAEYSTSDKLVVDEMRKVNNVANMEGKERWRILRSC